jgi:hypothetical protein
MNASVDDAHSHGFRDCASKSRGGEMVQNGNMPQAEGGLGGLGQLDLGALTKYVAVSGGLAYATGMLAVNIYLHQLGITDFSLAKPKLILTGVVVLLTFLLLALFPISVARPISGRRAEGGRATRPPKRMLFLMLFPLVGLIAASASLCFKNPPGLGQIVVWKVWEVVNTKHQTAFNCSLTTLVITAAIYLPICLAAVSASTAAGLFNRAKSGTTLSRIVPERVYFSVALALAVISVIGYIYIFSLTFYPAIPPAFGGGKPYVESFVIAAEERCQWQPLGIPFVHENSNATAPLPVLHESDVMVAVWLTDKPESWKPMVVELDKNQISAALMVDPLAEKMPILPSLPAWCTTSSSHRAVNNP